MSTFEDENNFKIFVPNTSRAVSSESKQFLHAFSSKQEKVEKFNKDLKPTPLVKVARSEEIFGIGNVLIKDEGQRLGLKAFKVFYLFLFLHESSPRLAIILRVLRLQNNYNFPMF